MCRPADILPYSTGSTRIGSSEDRASLDLSIQHCRTLCDTNLQLTRRSIPPAQLWHGSAQGDDLEAVWRPSLAAAYQPSLHCSKLLYFKSTKSCTENPLPSCMVTGIIKRDMIWPATWRCLTWVTSGRGGEFTGLRFGCRLPPHSLDKHVTPLDLFKDS